MVVGLVGRKAGMTRVFTEAGESVPVTVIEVTPNRVTQVKTTDRDGYNAVQVTSGSVKVSRLNKAEQGFYKSVGVEPGQSLREFRLTPGVDLKVGDELKADHFETGQKVDVSGVSKGKGFTGTVRRWNFRTQDNTHGNSISHRAPGSIGQCQTPGRVWKGKKMSGQMGNKRITVQSLEVVRVDSERNLLLIKGAVPGAMGGELLVKPAIKSSTRA